MGFRDDGVQNRVARRKMLSYEIIAEANKVANNGTSTSIMLSAINRMITLTNELKKMYSVGVDSQWQEAKRWRENSKV